MCPHSPGCRCRTATARKAAPLDCQKADSTCRAAGWSAGGKQAGRHHWCCPNGCRSMGGCNRGRKLGGTAGQLSLAGTAPAAALPAPPAAPSGASPAAAAAPRGHPGSSGDLCCPRLRRRPCQLQARRRRHPRRCQKHCCSGSPAQHATKACDQLNNIEWQAWLAVVCTCGPRQNCCGGQYSAEQHCAQYSAVQYSTLSISACSRPQGKSRASGWGGTAPLPPARRRPLPAAAAWLPRLRG